MDLIPFGTKNSISIEFSPSFWNDKITASWQNSHCKFYQIIPIVEIKRCFCFVCLFVCLFCFLFCCCFFLFALFSIFEKIAWFHETNGVTLHIGTNNSFLTNSEVSSFWNRALHIFVSLGRHFNGAFCFSQRKVLNMFQSSDDLKLLWEK